MQLPRGTFREIKKNETIENLLVELERTRFSGICSISSPSATGTLVFTRGKCILVKFNGKSGDAGWDELQKGVLEEVDAVLSTLDEAQLQLSLEFNKACRLVRGGKPAQQPAARPVPPPHREPAHHEPVKKPAPAAPAPAAPVKLPPKPAPAPAAPVPPRPAAPLKPSAPAHQPPPKPVPQAPPAQAHPASRSPLFQKAEEKPREPGEETAETGPGQGSFEKDIDTFDSMDLENVTDKIRNDCKTMIKQLHLEHLMER